MGLLWRPEKFGIRAREPCVVHAPAEGWIADQKHLEFSEMAHRQPEPLQRLLQFLQSTDGLPVSIPERLDAIGRGRAVDDGRSMSTQQQQLSRLAQ
jgi:hypothetical protein